MRNFKIDQLFVIVSIDFMTKKPTVYPKIFTSKEDAEEILPHIPDGIIKETFINDSID